MRARMNSGYVITYCDAVGRHFTGKERDFESGNDYFGARYYGSSMGRFLSPDWSAKVEPVPYAKLDDPQTLNLYAYVGNNPLSSVDADGHCNAAGSCDALDFMGNGQGPVAAQFDARVWNATGGNPEVAASYGVFMPADGGARQQTTPKPGRQPDGSYIAPTGPGTEIGNITDPAHPLPPLIGNGQCVTACKHFSGITAPTADWREGAAVSGNSTLPIGTAIATFGSNGRYPTGDDRNSGIYMGQIKNGGILILDQWPAHPVSGTPAHPPQIREMKFNNGDMSNSASAYHVIIVP
jgi:RHS repeat-associated protein